MNIRSCFFFKVMNISQSNIQMHIIISLMDTWKCQLVRNTEWRCWLNTSKIFFLHSVAFGMRKALQAEQGKADMERKVGS